jgi:hypothetical protein
MQGGRMSARRRRFQPAQGRRRGQVVDPAHRRLQRQIATQHVVVAHVLPPTAQAIDPLCKHVAHAVRHTGTTSAIVKYARYCPG